MENQCNAAVYGLTPSMCKTTCTGYGSQGCCPPLIVMAMNYVSLVSQFSLKNEQRKAEPDSF
jgi:predicted metal-binding protein